MGYQTYSQYLASRPRTVQAIALGFVVTFTFFLFLRQDAYRPSFRPRPPPHGLGYVGADSIPKYVPVVPRIAKISMLYGKANPLYQRAIASHERHSAIHGYPTYILHNEVAKDYWNKPAFIMSKLLQEMERDPGDRVQWLMWVDADSIIMNPELPAEIFLPPHDHAFDETYFLATKDGNGLNTGIFFLRVNDWSIRYMAKTMAFTMFKPDVDLGFSADQRAMEILANETEFRNHTVFVPKKWINAGVGETQPGDLLVHFPGLIDRDWHMQYWLNRAEGPEAPDWTKYLNQTDYAQTTTDFWNLVKECNTASRDIAQALTHSSNLPADTMDDIQYLIDACWYHSDKPEFHREVKNSAEDTLKQLLEPVPKESEDPPPP